LKPRQQLLLEGICGTEIYRVPGLDGRSATVSVAVIDAPPWCRQQTDVLQRKQELWFAPGRNSLIAGVASALAQGDPQSLRHIGLPSALIQQAAARPLRTVIIVEGIDHARCLGSLLPGWSVAQYMPQLNQGPLPDPLSHLILTVGRARQIPNCDTDIIIWAGGDGCEQRLPGFPPRRAEADAGSIWLIDVADRCDPQSVRCVRQRVLTYRARGWAVYCDSSDLAAAGPTTEPHQ
jgi:hypothetical protein